MHANALPWAQLLGVMHMSLGHVAAADHRQAAGLRRSQRIHGDGGGRGGTRSGQATRVTQQ